MIEYRAENGIARIRLNRPEKRNAINEELLAALKESLSVAAADASVRLILISGAGKDFCAGLDISAMANAARTDVTESIAGARRLAELFVGMRRNPRPIIAAVHGRALGGGCGIATACDVVLAAESAQFGYPEIRLGFVPAIVAALVRHTVPQKRMMELALTGEPIRARQALDIGMINRVFPDEAFEAEVGRYVSALAAKSGSAMSMTKRLLYETEGISLEAAIEAGVQANAAARMTPDFREGIERFVTRNEPQKS